jgi:hypothetical protein
MLERPNTVSGLIAKRDELVKYRKQLEQDLRAVTCDLDHLDAAIRLFDPEQTPAARKRYATKHRAKKGTVRRFVLRYLREATAPATSRQITELWIKERGLKADDATFVLIRKRIGACLTALKEDGLAEGVGLLEGYVAWARRA